MPGLFRLLVDAQPGLETNSAAVRVELVGSLYAYQPAVLTANLLNGALVAVVFEGVVARSVVIFWYALLSLMVAARAVLWILYRRRKSDPDRIGRWSRFATVGSGISGLL